SCGVGLVANIKGVASHEIMTDAYRINSSMDHRGGCGFEENTGDGAGVLTAIPHNFFTQVCSEINITLPAPQEYTVGNIFLPQDSKERAAAKQLLEGIIKEEGQTLLGWREVPIALDKADVGPAARDSMPFMEQVVVAASGGNADHAFDRALYLIRKRFTIAARQHSGFKEANLIYVCSLNSRIIVYKGMLTPGQLFPFYPDLEDERYESHLAMVHSRFSTNTFPSWDRAQPNRFMSHNGEINTLMGNRNWMTARQGVVAADRFGDRLQDLFPIVEPDCSDSGTFDNALEFLMMTGRSLQEAIMMMIPEAWQSDANMNQDERAFYEYHSALMEPWDGPASIVFTDGHYIGAVLDRNGLRPSRYYLTHDDKVIMASEVGVLDVAPEQVKEKGRLQPGKMFLVDFLQGRMIPDQELKTELAGKHPYGKWLAEQKIELASLVAAPSVQQEPFQFQPESLVQRMQAFGYTAETMQFMLLPLVTEARDPLGSMGNDAALACLSDKPRMLYDYFKQLFAQITNPAIDSIREEVVMSLECFIGPEGNLADTSEAQAHRLAVPHPVLSNQELAGIRNMDATLPGWKSLTLDTTFNKADGKAGMLAALDRICAEATTAIEDGYAIVILSDRKLGADRLALPSLLACGAVHHHLVRNHQRTRLGLVLESGEAREVHHHCLLSGYGADAINPYLAFESLWQAQMDGQLSADDYPGIDSLVAAYRKGIAKGMLKVMAKMGISTLQSYKGAQIFEAVGLAD
ncbi:MAG: glutamate synthase central domain-containing protein, partial [Pseudomonadales bacterium]